MIYGANGYTGALCAEEAVRRGWRPVLAGRTAERIVPLAERLGLEHRIFGLGEPSVTEENLSGIELVLHCAGPFSATSRPMVDACVRTRSHYFDITGEIGVFEYIHENDARWRDANIAAIPGMGFDVVPTDCLAAMVKEEMPDAHTLRIGFKGSGFKMSAGTTKTMIEGLSEGAAVRRHGRIERIPPGSLTREVPFTDGQPEPAVAIPWGDLATAWYSTGIPNIETYLFADPAQLRQLRTVSKLAWLFRINAVRRGAQALVGRYVKGPNEDERQTGHMLCWAEAEGPGGRTATRRLRTPEGYWFTVLATLAGVDRWLNDGLKPGAQTPSMAFGPRFVLDIEGVEEGVSDAAPSRA
jgi:short subunit dehydrogenase-like uncharacterized protein